MDPVDIGRFASPVLHGCGLCWKINVAAFASRIVLVFLSPRHWVTTPKYLQTSMCCKNNWTAKRSVKAVIGMKEMCEGFLMMRNLSDLLMPCVGCTAVPVKALLQQGRLFPRAELRKVTSLRALNCCAVIFFQLTDSSCVSCA
jgi:hypothetical protein